MDPISALSLAANIYAFVDAGFKAVNQFNDFRHNALSETRDNTQCRIITTELMTAVHKLAADGPDSLKSIGESCSKLCIELIHLLDKLTVKDPDSVRGRLWIILKCYFRSSEVASMEDRLDTYRQQLMVTILGVLR